MTRRGTVRYGVSGWDYDDWRGPLYLERPPAVLPSPARLARFLDFMEVNVSYYRILPPGPAIQWLEETPTSFTFAFKAWRGWTHDGVRPGGDEIVRFLDLVAPAAEADRLEGVLAQLPPGVRTVDAALDRLLPLREALAPHRLFAEVRHRDLYRDDFFAALERETIDFVNVDLPPVGALPRPSRVNTGPVAYLRLHGRNRAGWARGVARDVRYDHGYSPEEIAELAATVETLLDRCPRVLVGANNHYRAQAPAAATLLRHAVEGGTIAVPERLRRAFPEVAARTVPLPETAAVPPRPIDRARMEIAPAMVLPTGRDLSEEREDIVLSVRRTERERLDRYLLRKLGWGSRTKIQRLVQLGRVEVNGRPGKPALRVGAGDTVRVRLIAETSRREIHPPLDPPLHEDPYLFAISKPPGRLVHPTGRTITGTVVDELHARVRPLNERGGRTVVPRLCHRLDRDTSGLLLVAKTVEIRRAVQEAFEADRVRKGYLAVIEGIPEELRFEVDAPIDDHLDRRRPHSNRLARVDASGRASVTRFEVLGSASDRADGPGFSVVHCRPLTGRQNQIRAHLAEAGFPILGDTGFGSDPERVVLPPGLAYPPRALLHSAQLRFRHPIWGTERELRAPIATDLRPFLIAASVVEADIPRLEPLERS